MAVAMKDAILAVVPDPKTFTDADVRAAYQIARLIRNAFAHAPFWLPRRIGEIFEGVSQVLICYSL
jgi:class 3 adenylate cyclase